MLRFINSDFVPNFYIRVLLLVSTIVIFSIVRHDFFSKKISSSYKSASKYYKLNYFIHVLIFFVIPLFFQIDNNFVLIIIKYIGGILNFIYSFNFILNLDIFLLNFLLTPLLFLFF